MDFIVNYKFNSQVLERYSANLVPDIFNSALSLLSELGKSLNDNLAPNVARELRTIYTQSEEVLTYAKNTAQIVSDKDYVTLKFSIQNNKACYNEVNSEQKRMWLRDLLDTCILHYIRIGLVEAKYNCTASGKDASKYILYLAELEKALKGSHNKRTERFFIENE